MASDGAASRRPPLAPPTKRRAVGDLLQPDLLTYKRRRRASSDNSAAGRAVASGPDQNQTSMVARASNSNQGAYQMRVRHWRSWRDTLEHLLQSPSVNQGSGGIQSCIRDALRHKGYQPVEHADLGEGQGGGREDPSGAVPAKENNGALLKLESATANNGDSVKLEDAAAASLEASKAMCHNALFDVLVSEKFALLCDLLVATFHVHKPDDVIGLRKIDAKMRRGDYAQNPALLDHDIKQIWKKFEQVGQEMVGLASSLSLISQACQKQASGVSEIDTTENKIEETSLVGVADKVLRESTPPCDSGHSTIPKRSGTSGPDGICKDCGRKADSERRIICDRCEAAFHVSCLKLAIDEDVPAKWYCPTCTELDATIKNNNNDRSHEDCNVCEWLEFKKPEEEHPEDVSRAELAVRTQESSVSSMDGDSEPDLSTTALSNLCKHCGTCEDEDKKFLVCGHPYCAYKYYHVLCLKQSQIASEKQKNRACWYCPSCLCRGCFKAKNDELTVLCDGCDDAYHIYCMNPPRDTIPKGSWYCTSCCARRSVDGMQKYEKSVLESVMHGRGAKRSKMLADGAPENK